MDERGGIRSLAIAFPGILRTNDYWRERYPELIEAAESHTLARLWAAGDRPDSTFDRVMAPYLDDPFRGAVERRIRGLGETALDMEVEAGQAALAAAGLGVDDIDLVLVSSFVGDRFGVGNAAYLAERLGLSAPAWNFESACSGSIVGLHMAATLVGRASYRRILVVASASNSVQVSDRDTIAWFVGDGAGAFVVEVAQPGFGVLGWKTINTIGTNDMFVIHSVPDEWGATRLLTGASPRAGTMARSTAEPYLRECVDGALTMAGCELTDVDFWVFNTPNAWYSDFCAELLGIGRDRHRSVYPRYANIGAALMPTTLYHALADGLIHPGQLVGLYAVGSSSTANALIMRVGDIALGPAPARPEPNADLRRAHDRSRDHDHTPPIAPPRLPAWVEAALANRPPASSGGGGGGGAEAEADELFTLDHQVSIGLGRTLHLREHASVGGLDRATRRAILLLPGPATVGSFFNLDVDGYRFADMLARHGWLCFTVDMEGSGTSASSLDGRAIDHACMVTGCRTLLSYVTALRGVASVAVLGESNGGAVAADLADDDRVSACVLASMLYQHGTPLFNSVYRAPGFLAPLRQQPGGYLVAEAEHYQHITMTTPPEVSAAVLASQPGRYPVGPLLAPATIPWFDPSRARAPALIIQGTDDDIAKPCDAEALALAYGRDGGGEANIAWVLGGHIPRIEARPIADQFSAAVLEFLQALSPE